MENQSDCSDSWSEISRASVFDEDDICSLSSWCSSIEVNEGEDVVRANEEEAAIATAATTAAGAEQDSVLTVANGSDGVAGVAGEGTGAVLVVDNGSNGSDGVAARADVARVSTVMVNLRAKMKKRKTKLQRQRKKISVRQREIATKLLLHDIAEGEEEEVEMHYFELEKQLYQMEIMQQQKAEMVQVQQAKNNKKCSKGMTTKTKNHAKEHLKKAYSVNARESRKKGGSKRGRI